MGEDKEVHESLKLVRLLKNGADGSNDENIASHTLYTDYCSNLKLLSVHLNKVVISAKNPVNWSILNKLLPELNKLLSNLAFIVQSTRSSLLRKSWLRLFTDILDSVEGLLSSIIYYSYKDILNHSEIIHQLTTTTIPDSELQALRAVLNQQQDILIDTQREIKELDLDVDSFTPQVKKILSISNTLPEQFKSYANTLKETDDLTQVHTKCTHLCDIWDDVVYHLDEFDEDDFKEAADEFEKVYSEVFGGLEEKLNGLKL